MLENQSSRARTPSSVMRVWSTVFVPRLLTAAVLLVTAGLWLSAAVISDTQREWLFNDYGFTRDHFLVFYGVAFFLITIAFIFEPHLRHELRDSHALGALCIIAIVVSAGGAMLGVADQQFRVFRQVPLLYMTVAYSVACAVCLVLLGIDQPLAAPTRRMTRYVVVTLVCIVAALTVVHVLSVGRFLRLDDIFDEFLLAGNTTNFAETGNLTSSYLDEIYGDFDPSIPRYFAAAGLWLRWFSETPAAPSPLVALRSWSLLVGACGVLLTALLLWRIRGITTAQRWLGIAILLASTVLVRTSHNLRGDIGLLVYAVLLLWMWLEAHSPLSDNATSPRRRPIFFFLAGVVLYIGLETHTLVGFLHGFSYGLILIVQSVLSPSRRDAQLQRVIPYAGGASLACAAFLIVHLAPDFADKFATVQSFQAMYVATDSVAFAFPLSHFGGVFAFNAALSPIEPFIIFGVMSFICVWGKLLLRSLALIAGLSLLLNWTLLNAAFSYNIVLLPVFVYCAIHLVRTRAVLIVATFVLVPAVAMTMGRDLVVAIDQDANGRTLDELQLIDWHIPDGTRLVGSDIFFITLQDRTDFIGAGALQYIAHRWELEPDDPALIERLDVDMIICDPVEDRSLCELADQTFDNDPIEFAITRATYRIYVRQK